MKITDITRSSLIDHVLLRERPFHGRLELLAFLKRVWDLSSMPSTDSRFQDAAGDIWQHMVNNFDWSYDYLLRERLDLSRCDDNTFLRFIETCVHPLVSSNDTEIKALVEDFNRLLAKDGYRLIVTEAVSGRPIYRAAHVAGGSPDAPEREVYEIVLSFAGEDRAYVEQVADGLTTSGVSCFYDRYEDVTLWGKDLAVHLDRVYRSARYCVMFISKYYADKLWPNHERGSALARSVEEKVEYILPARFDSTEVPGIRHTIGYVDLREKTPQQLVGMILKKLGRNSSNEGGPAIGSQPVNRGTDRTSAAAGSLP